MADEDNLFIFGGLFLGNHCIYIALCTSPICSCLCFAVSGFGCYSYCYIIFRGLFYHLCLLLFNRLLYLLC